VRTHKYTVGSSLSSTKTPLHFNWSIWVSEKFLMIYLFLKLKYIVEIKLYSLSEMCSVVVLLFSSTLDWVIYHMPVNKLFTLNGCVKWSLNACAKWCGMLILLLTIYVTLSKLYLWISVSSSVEWVESVIKYLQMKMCNNNIKQNHLRTARNEVTQRRTLFFVGD
jgi:hypothetical protein